MVDICGILLDLPNPRKIHGSFRKLTYIKSFDVVDVFIYVVYTNYLWFLNGVYQWCIPTILKWLFTNGVYKLSMVMTGGWFIVVIPTFYWLLVSTYPSEKCESMGMIIFPTEWKHKIHVPNQQPVYSRRTKL